MLTGRKLGANRDGKLVSERVTGLLAKSVALGVGGHSWPSAEFLAKSGRGCRRHRFAGSFLILLNAEVE